VASVPVASVVFSHSTFSFFNQILVTYLIVVH
jgi:hypothetical protein